MPMHDWTKVDPNIYHDFHQDWTMEIRKALNRVLPKGYSALVDQRSGGVVPDVLAVEYFRNSTRKPLKGEGGTLVEPKTRLKVEPGIAIQNKRANRVVIRHRMGEIVCIIEVVSPSNKAGKSAIRSFVKKSLEFLRAGVNVLIIDPFPPTPRDPHGLHPLIWDRLIESAVPFELPADEPLLLASYKVGDLPAELAPVAYLEPYRVGATMPDMPAWLDPEYYVNVPVESTYMTAWENCPPGVQDLVEHGRLPDEE